MRKNLLSSASTLALTIHVFAPFGMMAGAQAQSMVTFGPHQFQINRQQGASGTAGPDNVQPACNSHQAPPKDNTLIPGGSGQRTAPINHTVTYGPTNPAQVYDGDLAVVGTTGGQGGKGGSDPYDRGCVYNGGWGGRGGQAGDVSLRVIPGVPTPLGGFAAGNTAIVAYSHGGNGGTGGDTTRKELVGGNGGEGGDGGAITIDNALALNVTGTSTSTSSSAATAAAFGIVAQSGGGQGGAGGDADNGDKKSAGGSGVAGGRGGSVGITNRADIKTAGGGAIVAQSIGGFGGDAGTSVSGYGGGGGFGGSGGAIAITNSGRLTIGSATAAACEGGTTPQCNPAGMAGIAAQSVGGGGGDSGATSGRRALGASGGFAGDGGTVGITNAGAVTIHDVASAGLFAQSVGGGGGKGGMAFSSGERTTAIGGSGGGGGSGAAVSVSNAGAICTGGACTSPTLAVPDTAGGGFGIFAQSVGGGGGAGGFARARSTTAFGGSAHAVGGSGGAGGSGGKITVLNSGSIGTVEINSAGILAQSVGGGGGSGGGALSLASAAFGDAVSVSHGGSGGGGGNGGDVSLNCNSFSAISWDRGTCRSTPGALTAAAPTTNALIRTAGHASPGMIAQSIGGGGGNGGYAIALSASMTGAMALSFGGSGGSGGIGGEVFAGTNGVAITTLGNDAPGVLAQSVGGGGGSGGASIAAALSGVTALGLSIGGRGGSGNDSNWVTIHSAGSEINTSGLNSAGLMAQTVGGGGGSGGASITLSATMNRAVGLSLGGSGGSGGRSSGIILFNGSSAMDSRYGTGAITTTGYNSSAILAQSIGGGGGNGGFALSGALALGNTGEAGAISIGGSGGSGGDAGNVSVTNYGTLTTQGGGAAALLAQSIGGGGGNGGGAISGAIGGAGGIAVGAGGAGGSGAIGGRVDVDNRGAITVVAPNNGLAGHAPGIMAQSIGGGGGTGGFAAAGALGFDGAVSVAVGGGGGHGGFSSPVSITNWADISVAGPMSSAIVGQSLGGNGGAGGFALAGAGAIGLGVAASIGGGGGNGGRADTVHVALADRNVDLEANGTQSSGIVAQSIGGSGGMGGWAFSGALAGVAAPAISLGGSGGRGGNAGAVTIDTLTGQTLTTRQLLSPAILAQSIGGSGGAGGFSASAAGSLAMSPTLAIGGGGGDGSAAGSVYVNGAATIQTQAAQSAGIVAQSIGGSGGNGGSAVSAAASIANPVSRVSVSAAGAHGGNGGSGQSAGTVTVATRGTITTEGALSLGIVAQSIGGGGGNGGSSMAFSASASFGDNKSGAASVAVGGKGAAGGTGQSVAVAQYGAISTFGALSIGILAQSIGGSGGNGGSATSNAISQTGSAAVSVGGGGGVGSQGGKVAVGFDPYEYLASYPDLIQAYGDNPNGAMEHYTTYPGRAPNRFNAAQYLANYGDLRAAYGDDLAAAARHYVAGGYREGRTDAASAGVPVVGMPRTGDITTSGAHATAIVAQSIGGGGGNGGAASASATSNKHAASVAIGGFGAGGGDADAVVVVRDGGTLTTTGKMAMGIFAQSVGGGGGNGGSANSGAAGADGAVQDAGAAAWTGLVGQKVGNATLAIAGKLTEGSGGEEEEDEEADNGAAAGISIGGAGGRGGHGGPVRVETAATITTSGSLSHGVFAQSVGGGGGNGGSATSESKGGNASAAVSLGGGGGAGGNGRSVDVVNSGVISTGGSQSIGVYAQSVGGGGGNGGAANATTESSGSAAASLGIGGMGGSGGTSGNVTVRNSNRIQATGSNAAGVFAQSVGGGGGNGGAATSGAQAAEAQDKGDTNTRATTGRNPGAPSNGGSSATAGDTDGSRDKPSSKGAGAGADGGYAAGLAIGGAGGAGSNAGDVYVLNSGTIVTGTAGRVDSGANAQAIFAQSVGGGGGNGGSASSDANAGKASVALSMGGIGGGAGSGGMVRAGSTGTLTTHAANSAAIFAQSVGGGGGNGGSASSTTGDGGSTSVAMGLGGSGSGGGGGGNVAVCGVVEGYNCISPLTGTVTTFGANSYGVFAQSVGGGGGSGGAVTTAATARTETRGDGTASATGNSEGSSAQASRGAAVSLGLGGHGGAGGNGNLVSIESAARIATGGNFATALFAQSVGGGGGAGGASISNANGGTYAVSMALGGSGGNGGRGGDVILSAMRGSAVTTSGVMAHGLFAQSVGGGGGAAGSVSATSADSGRADGAMTLGGAGGRNQHGGNVTVWNDGTVATSGVGASAIMAQSVGGGGGNAVSRLATMSGGQTKMGFRLGGGGSAGDGGAVTIKSSFDPAVYTAGWIDLINAFGTDNGAAQRHYTEYTGMRSATRFNVAQYLANYGDLQRAFGGDYAGAANHYISYGRREGRTDAHLPGAADFTGAEWGRISTTGNQSTAIVAQSIGSGGGVAIAEDSRGQGSGSVDVPMDLGASNRWAGGRGSSVTVLTGDGTGGSGATLVTTGANSSGIVAQSIGGGGGISSFYSDAVASNAPINVPFSLGTKAHGHNEGGPVDLTVGNSTFDFSGFNSFGIAAQSIGGGGGLLAFAARGSTSSYANGQLGQFDSDDDGGQASSSSVRLNSHADMAMRNRQSVGILAQSVSAGGGAASLLTSGNDVFEGTVSLGKSLLKGGQNAGDVDVVNYGAITTYESVSPALIAQSVAGGGGLSLTRQRAVELGDGRNGYGGVVSVINGAPIITHGTTSPGIIAQSVAGGGGIANAVGRARLGGGEGGSDAKLVWLSSNAPITTYGHHSPGIIAQSVGGGGGIVMTEGSALAYTFAPGTGHAGDVTVYVNAPITTYGGWSPGLIAQSVSGGGGLIFNGATMIAQTSGGGGRSGNVNLGFAAPIRAYGEGSVAVIARSTHDPIIDIAQGVDIVGGPGGSALLLDSPINQITNAGHLTTMDGAAGQTVRTLSGDTTFTNKGVLTGSVTLAQGGANTLRNLAEGTINAGTSLDLGGGTLHNAGLLGNGGALGKTVITGSLIQSDTASLQIRLDQKTGAADSFEVTGTGKLAGQLRPTILDLTTIKPGTFVRTILTAAENLDVSGLRIGSSAILGHALNARDGKLSLATTIDFAPQALSRSGRVIGQVIANAQNAGQGHFRSMLPRLVGLVQHGDLDQAYYNLSGAGISAVSTVGTQMSNAFMTSLVRQPGGSDRNQTWNLWGQDLGGLSQTSNRGVGMGTLSTRLGGQALGIDARPDKDTLAGLAFSVGSTSFSTSNWVNGRSDVYQFGLYGVKRVEAAYVAGALSFGSHDTVLDRMLPLTGARYSSRFRGWHYGARLETGYRLETEFAGITPYGALQVQDFRTPASTETAADPQLSAAGLRFDRRSTWDTRFELGAALDRTFTLDGNRDLTLRASAAWLHRASSNPDVVAGFQAAKANRFSVGATAPVSDLALLSADLGLNLTPNLFVGVRVESELADRSHVFSGTGRVNYRW